MGSFTEQYLAEAGCIMGMIDPHKIEDMVGLLVDLKRRPGRLFILGAGGGAGHASHAVNDFRKLVGLEAYAPTDNVSELTARVNDDGWETTFVNWLKVSHLSQDDMVLIFSVGGGNLEHNISPNLVRALEYARGLGTKILGVVGRDGGYTARVADACLVVPTINGETITPHTEAFQAVIWHLLVSHPRLQEQRAKWEGATSELAGQSDSGEHATSELSGQPDSGEGATSELAGQPDSGEHATSTLAGQPDSGEGATSTPAGQPDKGEGYTR